MPVDALFKSLAEDSGEHAIAVVLSGGDSDGSLGGRAVRQAGGFTLAQRPETARFPDMPRHAIETDCIDLVLTPSEIARELVGIGQRLSAAAVSGSASRVDRVTDADEVSLRHIFRHVFPVVCEGLSGKRALRLWVPGCATGDEVYSVAMALLEYFGDSVPSARIQTFGTDVSETALQHARAGVYSASAVREISPERLERFFKQQDGEYRVVKDIRDLCLFATVMLHADRVQSNLSSDVDA